MYAGQNYLFCAVPENTHIPTMDRISLITHPSDIFSLLISSDPFVSQQGRYITTMSRIRV